MCFRFFEHFTNFKNYSFNFLNLKAREDVVLINFNLKKTYAIVFIVLQAGILLILEDRDSVF